MQLNQAEQRCREAVARPGSDLYYSLLGLDPARRRAVIALHAVAAAIDAGVGGASDVRPAGDTDPGERRLDWWREEIARLQGAGPPLHYASRALAPHIEPFSLTAEPLLALVDAARDSRRYDAYPSFAPLLRHCHRSGGSLALLRAKVLGYSQPASEAFAHDLGVMLSLIERLALLRPAADHNRLTIAEDELARFDIRPSTLLDGSVDHAALRPLLAFQAERIRDVWRRAEGQLPAVDRYPQRQQLALATLRLAWLDETERDGWRLLQRRVEITPLRKFWLVWRSLRGNRLPRVG